MPKARSRLWVIPLKSEWPTNLDGKPNKIPIKEQAGGAVAYWQIWDRPLSQVLQEVREVVSRHNVPIRAERLAAAKRQALVRELKKGNKA